MVAADLTCGPDLGEVGVRISSAGDQFIVALPVRDRPDAPIEVRRNGRVLSGVRMRPEARALLDRMRSSRVHLEASVIDRRLQVALDGVLLFDPIDYDDPMGINGYNPGPLAIGVRGGGSIAVSGLKVYRDVFYTSALANILRRPYGVDEPYRLGAEDYFVLGDNSPVSNDSRFWNASPVVPRDLFLGKPFLVHLPGQVVPLRVFGRSLYWVPDPREIRYIR